MTVDSADRRELVVDASQVLLPAAERFFIDSLTATGDLYLIPSEHRFTWQAYDMAVEFGFDVPPVPEWAKPIGELSHVEFENAREVM